MRSAVLFEFDVTSITRVNAYAYRECQRFDDV
jgi:hypothetical protein